jgi:transglutaminase-like putative cysteine protease
MKIAVNIRSIIIRLIKNTFYRHTYLVLNFILTMLLLKILQVMYKIRDFNYMYVVLLFCLGIAIFEFYRKVLGSHRKRIFFTVIIILIISALALRNKVHSMGYLNLLVKYYSEIYQYFYLSKDTFFYQYVPFITLVLPFIAAVVMFMFSKGYGNAVLLITLLYLVLLWYTAELVEARFYVLFYIIIACLTYGYDRFKNTVNLYVKQGIKISLDLNRTLMYILTLSIVLGVFTFISVKAFGIKDIFTIAHERREKSKYLEKKSFNNKYDLSMSGYPDSSEKLGGPIVLNYDVIFSVQADGLYYLKGRVKDFYDGYKWVKTEDKYERLSEASRLFQGRSFMEAEVASLSIYPEGFDTSTLFSPSFTFDISLNKGQPARDKTGSYMILGSTEASASYTASFYRIKPHAELFREAYKNNLIINYKAGEEGIGKLYGSYLQLPANISERTYKLVGEITKDAKTTFDRVNSIQKYLAVNYKYSLEVSEVPENTEFVDYFLFEGKKGYCTYFASAVTVMCRLAGIPARYVEGFNMEEERDSYGRYEVRNSMAHAWTEVLVNPDENIWCIVDATPEEREVVLGITETNSTGEGTKVKDNRLSSRTKSKVNVGFDYNITSVFIGLFFIAFCIVITAITIKVLRNIRFRKSVLSSDSIVPLYYYIRKRIKILYEDNKVPEDDFLWIDKTENPELKEVINKIVDAAYDEFYGKKLQKDFNKLEVYYFVESYIKNSQSRLKYYFLKLLKL